jgi:hypothetical protein
MKKIGSVVISMGTAAFFLLNLSQYSFAQNPFDDANKQTLLREILNKVRHYCRKLDSATFDFICLEEISEKIDYSKDILTDGHTGVLGLGYPVPSKSRMKKNTYLYDYQFIRKNREIQERRILLEENGKKKHEENARLKTQAFHFKNVMFGPLGLLSEFRQYEHTYRILKEEELNGMQAVLIEAVPKDLQSGLHLYGKIWIKKSDFSILKIEWDQKSLIEHSLIRATAKRYGAEPSLIMITEYGIEKHGIRFPSKLLIEEAYIDKKGKKFIRSETSAIYQDYKFFTVETEIEF